MTREQAQQAMREGKKVTHAYWMPHEWASIHKNYDGSEVLTEDQIRTEWNEWWHHRNGDAFIDGWRIWEAIDNSAQVAEQSALIEELVTILKQCQDKLAEGKVPKPSFFVVLSDSIAKASKK